MFWRRSSFPDTPIDTAQSRVAQALLKWNEGLCRRGRYSRTWASYGQTPVQITGGNAGCSCVAFEDLPVWLGPGETRRLGLRVRLPKSPGAFRRKATLSTSAARGVGFAITGNVR